MITRPKWLFVPDTLQGWVSQTPFEADPMKKDSRPLPPFVTNSARDYDGLKYYRQLSRLTNVEPYEASFIEFATWILNAPGESLYHVRQNSAELSQPCCNVTSLRNHRLTSSTKLTTA